MTAYTHQTFVDNAPCTAPLLTLEGLLARAGYLHEQAVNVAATLRGLSEFIGGSYPEPCAPGKDAQRSSANSFIERFDDQLTGIANALEVAQASLSQLANRTG